MALARRARFTHTHSMDERVVDTLSLLRFLKTHDPTSYFGVRALDSLKRDRVHSHRADIFGFLLHRYGEIPSSRYVDRMRHLRELQARFEQSNAYEASAYAHIRPIDADTYKIALLLSFVLTNHRFEILEALEDFLKAATQAPEELLSIGFGTGYELKLAYSILPEWRCSAYDTSAESHEYASDLLALFGLPTTGLRTELFPLEAPELPAEHHGRYGKIVLCEILEHLENPEAALRNVRSALHAHGTLFATMAINIAQEDHVYLYRTPDEARAQVVRAGFTIVREFVTPVTVMPFAERDRERIFTKGNYVCCLRKG